MNLIGFRPSPCCGRWLINKGGSGLVDVNPLPHLEGNL